MQQSLSELAVRAASDETAREQFIRSQERAILAVASKVAHRYLTVNDDEWAVALYAFSKAIDFYDLDKGSFSNYAEVVIRRSLIDYFRSEARHAREINTSPDAFTDGNDGAGFEAEVRYAVVKHSVRPAGEALRAEILEAAEALAGYGFRFFDLADCSPRQKRTKRECAAAIRFLLRSRPGLAQLMRTRQLPIGMIAEQARVPRKILERYRKYIIAAVVILSGDYPELSGYLNYVGEETEL